MGVNIGEASKASGLSQRMVRYYEKQGLLPAPSRSGGGYRSYSDDDVRRMRTIALAQETGFSTEAIRQLLASIDQAKAENAAEAEAATLAEVERKARALVELRGSISEMVRHPSIPFRGSFAETVEGHEPTDEELMERGELDGFDEPDIDWGPPMREAVQPRSDIVIRRVDSEADRPRGGPAPRARRDDDAAGDRGVVRRPERDLAPAG